MLFYYLTVLVLNSHSVALTFQPQMNHLFYYLLGQGLTWVILFVNPLVCLLPDFCVKTWRACYHKSPVDILLEGQRPRRSLVGSVSPKAGDLTEKRQSS